jgi:hypothetical protein
VITQFVSIIHALGGKIANCEACGDECLGHLPYDAGKKERRFATVCAVCDHGYEFPRIEAAA